MFLYKIEFRKRFSVSLHFQAFFEVSVLIFWWSAVIIYQGKIAVSFEHFQRLRDIEVPEEPTAKDRYYEGLVVFSRYASEYFGFVNLKDTIV